MFSAQAYEFTLDKIFVANEAPDGELATAKCHCNSHLAARVEDEGLRREEPIRHRAVIPIIEQASVLDGALFGAKRPFLAQPAAAEEEGEEEGFIGLVERLALPRHAVE